MTGSSDNAKIPWRTIRISDVWEALHGPSIRWSGHRGRAVAFWRSGDNPGAVSIDRNKNCWHDFVTGDGGGILRLVEVAGGGMHRTEALAWLESRYGAAGGDFDMVAWRQTQRLMNNARLWRAGRIQQLERIKARAFADLDAPSAEERADAWDIWAWSSRALYQVERLTGDALLAAFQTAVSDDSAEAARLIYVAIEDEQHATEIAALTLALIELREVPYAA